MMMKMNMIPALAVGVLLSSLPSFGKILYVSNTVGNDDYDGLAAVYDGTHGPKFKIQSAIDAADNGDTVIVAPGIYGDEQGAVPASAAGQTVRVYVDKSITLKSSGGRERTAIIGKRSDDTEQGWGSGAVSGIRIASTVATGADNPVEIEGFTFRDCHTDNTGKVGGVIGWNASTGPVFETGNGPWVVDCAISNCSYQAHGALGRVNAARVSGLNLYSDHAGLNAYQCNLVFCAFTGGRGQVGLSGNNSQYAINCTFANGSHASCSTGCKMNFYNSAFLAYANGNMYYTDVANCVLSAKIEAIAGDNKKNAFNGYNPQIASPLFGDFRPLLPTDSICPDTSMCGRGNVSWLELVPSKYRNRDLDGIAFSAGEDGSIHVGAIQTPMTPVAGFFYANTESIKCTNVTINAVRCAADATGGFYATQTFLDSNQWPRSYEVEVRLPEGKHFLRFQVGNSISEGSRFPVKDNRMVFVPEKGKLTKILAYAGKKAIYVDANNGNDESYDGLTENTPFKTLAKAMENVGADDVVVALPGTYSEGSMIQSATVIKDSPAPSLRSRVVVPAGVSLVSKYGAESAIIKGEHASTDTKHGEGAMRCVFLHKGARISGFTVTGGATFSESTNNAVNDNNSGAGIFCAEEPKASVGSDLPQTVVSDCIVSNNVAKNGGGGAYRGCKVIRCRFSDNGSEKEGGALADCCVYDSVFDRNYGARGMSNPREVRGCTFGSGTMNWGKTSARYALYSEPSSAVWPIYNCLFLGGARCPVKHVYNCIVPSHSNGDFIYSSRSGCVHENINVAKVETDALYTPAYDSAAANAANMDYVKDFELDGDVYGNPRRSNGGMDIGAVETDWRPRYAAMLGGKISVSEVSWEVVDTSTPGVMLHEGNSMAIEWPFGTSLRRARGVVKFCVAEGAVLKVVRNGSQVASFGSGLGEMRIAGVSELERLMFLAEGGSVEILGFNRQTPFAFIVR